MTQNQINSTLERMTQDQLDAMVRLHGRFLDGRLGGRRAILKNIDISGLSLKDQNLRSSDFSSCLMSGMNLSSTNFQEAALYACDLSESNLLNANFVRADLRGARIENANLEGADMERADLREGGNGYGKGQIVNFRGANMSGVKLSGSMACNADFSDAIMVGANMSKADMSGAILEGADLSDADVDGANFNGANLKSAILTGTASANFTKFGVDLSQSITDDNIGISVSDLGAPLAKLIEIHRSWVKTAGERGEQLDLSGVNVRILKSLKQERLTAIKATKAKFFGMNLYKLELQSAVLDSSDFRNCDMENADLRGSSFKKCNFSHSNLAGVNCAPLMFGGGSSTTRFSPCDFDGAKLAYTILKGAQLKNASFKGADLSYADLTGADLRDADFTGANMTGTILDETQTEGSIFDKADKPVFTMKKD